MCNWCVENSCYISKSATNRTVLHWHSWSKQKHNSSSWYSWLIKHLARCLLAIFSFFFLCVCVCVLLLIWAIQGGHKTGTLFVCLNFIRLNFIKHRPIFKLIYCLNKENICNNTITKDPTTPQVCRYTTM